MRGRGLTLEAVAAGADLALWRRLVRRGAAAYRVEARGAARRRTHLQSAKMLDERGAFLCEAAILDASAAGMRLLLARNCRLPIFFGVHVDLTGKVLSAAVAWRRDRLVGVRMLGAPAPAPPKPSDRAALKGRYYAVPN